nr:hypothetical protein [Tanacetum cinerariifolium]
MRPFSCPVTILNTLDPLGKFDRKADDGFLVGYSVSRSGPTWLFDIDTLTKSMNYQPVIACNQPNSSTDPQNTDDDATFEVKKPESEVHVSPSSSAKTKKHDDKTNKEATGKSPVELSTGVRNLSEEFEDFSDNSTNEVNAASTPVLAVGQISTNSTNTFSAFGPSNTAVSQTLGKSLYVDPSQYPDDPNIPALEDITYSDDDEDVGAADDFSNLETNIIISPIPTTRVHKDHPVSQIIGDLSSAPQTKSFMVYQMEVKSAFLYRTIEEEVYVCQPPGFKDPDYPDKGNDHTLFIKKQKGDILLVQVYVDDIIFGYANKDLCKAFEKLMKDKFQMSSMGELTFFLGLQVKQKQDGIFINQDKYVAEILRKFSLTDGKSASTPIDTEKPLLKDHDSEDVDVYTYRSMIVKRIFRYLKGKPHLGSWYPKDSPFNLVAYSDSDYVGASLDSKSTTGGCQFLGWRLISWQCKKQTVVATSSTEAEYVVVLNCYGFKISCWIMGFEQIIDFLNASVIQYALVVNPIIYVSCIKQYGSSVSLKKTNDVVRLQALIDRRKVIIAEDMVRQVLRLDDAESIDCLPNKKIFAELERMGYEKPSTKSTFYKVFFSVQWKFLINIILQCMSAKRIAWNEFSSSMASAVICLATSRKFNFSKYIFDSLVRNVDSSSKFYIDEDAAKPTPPTPATTPPHPQELIPSTSQDKIAQALDITKLNQWVRRLEKKNKLKALGLKRLRKVGTAQRVESSTDTVMDNQEDASKYGRIIAKIDADEDVTLEEVDAEKDAKAEPAELKEVIKVVTTAKLMTEVVTAATTIITVASITAALSAAKRRKGVVIRDPEETATPLVIVHSEPKSKDKGKGILVEEPKPLKKQVQIEQNEAYARELEVEFNANINWNEVIKQVKRKEKKDNAVLIYQALKRKPQTEAQARKNMMLYLKNMTGFKMDFFKEKSEKELEEEASTAMKRKSKSSEEKAAKKQKLDEEVEELKTYIQIVSNDEDDVYTEATPLALKVPVVDYQIHTENNKPYYKIIREDGNHQLFLSFISLLRNFDREDLEMLWKIVQERFASSKPKNFSDDFLLNTLKTIFEKPNVEA